MFLPFAVRRKRNGAGLSLRKSEQSPAKRVCEEKEEGRSGYEAFAVRRKRNGASFF